LLLALHGHCCGIQSNNKIGDEGAKHIAQALSVNNSVYELDLVSCSLPMYCFISSVIIMLLLALEGHCYEIQSDNLIGDEGMKFIGQALSINNSVRYLILVSFFVADVSLCFVLLQAS
jgi:hypothetical protein